MAFQNTSPCTPVTAKEVRGVEFVRADGKVDAQTVVTKSVGTSADAASDARIIEGKYEYSCGCWWPDVAPGGVCAACVKEAKPAIVCKEHFVVCECGENCCWKHSSLSEDRSRSLCDRCSLRERNKAMLASLRRWLGRAARVVFFK